MKIILLSAANNIHTVRWANALHEKGNDVYVISCKNHKEGKNKFNENVHISYMKYNSGIGYYLNRKNLKKSIGLINPDIINVHYASGYGTLARVSNIKTYLLNVWGSDIYLFPRKSFWNKYILKKNLKSASYIASTSNCMMRETQKYISKDIFITPFGVDITRFYPMFKNKDKIIIGTVKTLEDIYGIEVLIRAINELRKMTTINFEYHIYGNGVQKQKYIDLVNGLHLNDIVFFKGYCPNNELTEVINGFTLSIFGSFSESFGVSAIESMACGVPVIATDVDGFREVIDDGESGELYQPGDYKRLAYLILKYLENPSLMNKYSMNSIDKVHKLYDWDKNVDNMLNIYTQIVNR